MKNIPAGSEIGGTNMADELSSSVKKVQDALKGFGLACEVIEMQETTRSAQDAAHALSCDVGQIVKSLLFKGTRSKKPILVVASGANRINTKKLRKILDEPIKMAHADFVLEITGFAIGGVPPLGHAQKSETFIDEDLLQYDEIWAAAGTLNSMFKLTPTDLQTIAGGRVISVK